MSRVRIPSVTLGKRAANPGIRGPFSFPALAVTVCGTGRPTFADAPVPPVSAGRDGSGVVYRARDTVRLSAASRRVSLSVAGIRGPNHGPDPRSPNSNRFMPSAVTFR